MLLLILFIWPTHDLWTPINNQFKEETGKQVLEMKETRCTRKEKKNIYIHRIKCESHTGTKGEEDKNKRVLSVFSEIFLEQQRPLLLSLNFKRKTSHARVELVNRLLNLVRVAEQNHQDWGEYLSSGRWRLDWLSEGRCWSPVQDADMSQFLWVHA